MDALRQWALCLIAAAAAGTFVCAVTPRGAVDKAMRTVAGLFVVAAVCAPITKLESNSFGIPAFADSAVVSDCGETLKEQMLESCRKAIENQILSLSKKYSLTVCNVKLDAYIDEYNSIIIRDIHLEINSETPQSVSLFLSEAEAVLGVPVSIRNGILT